MTTHEFERRVKGGVTRRSGAGGGGSQAGSIAMVVVAAGAMLAYVACGSLRDSGSRLVTAERGHFVSGAMSTRTEIAPPVARVQVASASTVHPSIRGHRAATARHAAAAPSHAAAIAGGYIGGRSDFAPGPANLSSDLSVRILAAWQSAAESAAKNINLPNLDGLRAGIDDTVMPMMDDLVGTGDEFFEMMTGRRSLSDMQLGASLPVFAGVGAFFVVIGMALIAALYSITQSADGQPSGIYRLGPGRR